MQLTFITEPIDIRLNREIQEIINRQEKVRKKLFAENNQLKKEVNDLKKDLEFLKANICKGEFLL